MKTLHSDFKPISIKVDYREKGTRIVRSLIQLGEFQITRENLEAGDYQIQDVTFERKTMPDFMKSVQDGRLFMQALKLKKRPGGAVIILEGSFKDLMHSGMKREAIQGTLIALMIKFGIPVLRSISPEESARLMLYTVNQLNDNGIPKNRFIRPKRTQKSLKNRERSQLNVLQGIPGIGPHRSKLLLEKFETLFSLFQADLNVLREVPGIGAVQAKNIYDTIHHEWSGSSK